MAKEGTFPIPACRGQITRIDQSENMSQSESKTEVYVASTTAIILRIATHI